MRHLKNKQLQINDPLLFLIIPERPQLVIIQQQRKFTFPTKTCNISTLESIIGDKKLFHIWY